jgi:curved DNA-binding protein CbpA
MSSTIAGKYQDHYQVLGIEPNSDSDVIQLAYTTLAQKYHPNNADTGDAEKFEAVNMAYEVLADPVLRRGFDQLKGVGRGEGPPKFSGLRFFDALGRDSGLRTALLCVMYDRRRTRPFTPSLSMRNIENTLESTTEELTFALWYLKQRGFVTNDEKSSLQITVEGIDRLENNRPSPEVVMPFIKPAALDAPPAIAETPPPETAGEDKSDARTRMGARVVGLLKNNTAAAREAV